MTGWNTLVWKWRPNLEPPSFTMFYTMGELKRHSWREQDEMISGLGLLEGVWIEKKNWA